MPATANRPAVVAALPFTASAHEHVEPAFTVTVVPGAAAQTLNPIDIPASGYLRSVLLEVTCAGGTGGTIAADGPWNIFQSIHLHDVNGGKMYGPLDGYAAYLSNVVGGHGKPGQGGGYVGTAPNPKFLLRIPVEITPKNGLGSLANQSTASEYKLDLVINTLAAAYSVAPSPVPTYTIKGWLEAWTLPAPQNAKGQIQSQVPPLLGSGMYWSSRIQQSIAIGENQVRLQRVGNYLRCLIYVARDGSGVRSDSVFPDPCYFNWDGITILRASQGYLKQKLIEILPVLAALPTGVFCIPFHHGGPMTEAGNEDPDLWLPTTAASRIEVQGVSAAAGSIQELVCDVAPVEQSQGERYQVPNDTGQLANP